MKTGNSLAHLSRKLERMIAELGLSRTDGIRLVTKLAKQHKLRDWPNTRNEQDYLALMAVVSREGVRLKVHTRKQGYTKSVVDSAPEFPFAAAMPKGKKLQGPRQVLFKRLHELADAGMTKKEIAAHISPLIPHRTLEPWVHGRSLPPDWSAQMVLEKLAHL